ncbi:MAG: 1-acylglycerol-3-phosphate O-acyltransferase [Chitinivibrionales bacterium]|nr:1-acylglycerol-3-phosphate O-acyltransferase [Chitinivibrionales bacterium]
MAQQNGGIAGARIAFHTIFGIPWIIVSTTIYAIMAILLSIFSRKAGMVIARLWSRQLLALCGVKVSIDGLDKIKHSSKFIIVSNHQSHLDIPVLMSVLSHIHLTFIAKKELFLIPVFGWGVYMIGNVSIDRSSARKGRVSLAKAAQRLQEEDISVVLFPEGTRSETGDIGGFKRGGFSLAIESGLTVVPVAIIGTRSVLSKKSYTIHPGRVAVRIGNPIDVSGMGRGDKEMLMRNVREKIVEMSA